MTLVVEPSSLFQWDMTTKNERGFYVCLPTNKHTQRETEPNRTYTNQNTKSQVGRRGWIFNRTQIFTKMLLFTILIIWIVLAGPWTTRAFTYLSSNLHVCIQAYDLEECNSLIYIITKVEPPLQRSEVTIGVCAYHS